MQGNWGAVVNGFCQGLRLDRFTKANEKLRVQAVCIASCLMIFLQFINLYTMYMVYHGWTYLHWLSVAMSISLVVSIFIIRYIKVGTLHSILYAMLIFSGIFFAAVPDQTGINTSLLPFLLFGSVIIGFINGKLAVTIYTLCSIGFIWFLYTVSMNAIPTLIYDASLHGHTYFNRAMQTTIASAIVSVAICLFSHSYQSLLDQLEEKVRQAQRAEHIKAQFLSNMSHELRTPLNGVIGMSGLLLETKLDEKQSHYANIVHASSLTLIAIINDVLDSSKMDAHKFTLKPETFNLHDMLESLVALHYPSTMQADIFLSVRYPEHLPKMFVADQGRLRQVVNNLLGNAIKFTSQGSVTLFVDGTEDERGNFDLYLAVKDTGIGIAPEHLGQIFERFEQVDNDLSKQHTGTGLGLSIAREIIECMGGEMKVASQEHHGSVFYFNLSIPLATEVESIGDVNDNVQLAS
ncbi:MAG: hypothetical protein COA43_02610 [Robiginitomaculum sp.]|nr:MAG: hypothetical protein COA43_02610 [Robiginitomaculum sp.]